MAEKEEEKSTYQKRKEAKETKAKEAKVKEVKKPKAKKYSARGYCNIIGATQGIHFVARLKFKDEGKKTIEEWKEIFKKRQIV